MKKKLIAIVASLAMVATMVPATAFAAADKVTNMDGITIGLPEGEQKTEINTFLSGNTGGKNYEELTGEVINADVTGTYADGKLTLTGTVPYTEGLTKFSSKAAMQKGNYIAFAINAPKPKTAGAEGWAFTNIRNNVDENGQSITEYILNTYKYGTYDAATRLRDDETIVLRVNGNTEKTFTVYYLGTDGEASDASAFDAERLGATPSATIYSTKAAMDEVIAKANNNIAGTKKLTVDLSGLTLLTKVQTASKQGFVDAVADIGRTLGSVANDAAVEVALPAITADNQVTSQYRQKAVAARAIYGSLDATVKSIVDDAVAARDDTQLKQAYKALETAEANIKAYDTLTSVAALVAALPAAKDFDLKDAAAVKQVKAAQAAVADLPTGAQKDLLETTEYLTQNQIVNYRAVTTKLNDAGVQDVIDAIDALPRLPKEFTDKASVDAVFTPMNEANDAYEDLDKDGKSKVTNYSKLDTYQKNYTELISDLVDPIWKEAAKIDVDKALTDEEKALINELKTYIEGGYLPNIRENLTNYSKATYDALIAALGNEQPTPDISLKDAAIAAIEEQTYTGAAIEPAVTVTDKDGAAIPAEGYTVSYKDNTNVGTATVTVTNKKDDADVISATFTIKAATLTDAMVKNIGNVTYTGKAIKPAVSAATAGVTFDVAYKNNTAVGKATATITGTGNYTGTITKNFIVKPAKEAISSLKAGKKSLTVAYKAQTGAKYRVVYSPAKGQAKAVNTTATKKTIKNLKAGKTYKVKVRAYKTIDGTTYNGTYSTVKKVKVK